MSELPNVQTPTAGESQATPVVNTPEPTLEQIAKEIPVEEQVRQFDARPAVPAQQYQPQYQQPQQPYVPDPITDQEGYKRWVLSQHQVTQQFDGALREISREITEFKRAKEQERIEADISSAVTKVNEKLKVDPMYAELALDREYRTNPTFKFIWDNRHRNPQALDKAIGVLSTKFAGVFQVRQDPQLTENVRAAQSSQQSMAAPRQPQDNGVPTDPAEFSRYWSRLVNGG